MFSHLFVAAQVSEAANSTWGQCSCRAGEPKSNKYSIVINASLCVSAESQGQKPYCDITINCLDDRRTGPNCKAHPSDTGDLFVSIQTLTKARFGSSKLSGILNLKKILKKKDLIAFLRGCLKRYRKRVQGTWSWNSHDGTKIVACVNTSSGWLHVIITSGVKHGPLAKNVGRVSYQFAPKK